MTSEADLLETEAELAPWDEARRLWPRGAVVMRVIRTDLEEQEFVRVLGDGEAHRIFDGATAIRPTPQGRSYTPEEHDAIVAEYDRRWRERHGTRR